MAIVMNMSSYVIEETSATDSRYEDDAMHAYMSPSLQLVTLRDDATLGNRLVTLPPGLATIDIEMFVQRMSAERY
jgi:hypothetical protein